MKIEVVEALPPVEGEGFAPLPEIPERAVLSVAIGPWRHAEAEKAAAAIIEACMVAGQWQAVSKVDLTRAMRRHGDFHFMPDVYHRGVWELLKAGDIKVFQLGAAPLDDSYPELADNQYVIPLPSMTHKALNRSAVGYYDEYDERRPIVPPTTSRRGLGTRLLRAIRLQPQPNKG